MLMQSLLSISLSFSLLLSSYSILTYSILILLTRIPLLFFQDRRRRIFFLEEEEYSKEIIIETHGEFSIRDDSRIGQISRASNPISRDSNDVITRINRPYTIKYDSLRPSRYTSRPPRIYIYIYKTQRNGELKRERFARGIGEDRSANTLKRLTRFFSR